MNYGKTGFGKITTRQWDTICLISKTLEIEFHGKNFDDAALFISRHSEKMGEKLNKNGGNFVEQKYNRRRGGKYKNETTTGGEVRISFLSKEELDELNGRLSKSS